MGKDAVGERSVEMCMMKVGDEGGIVVVRAIVVVVKVEGVGSHSTPVEVNMLTVGGWITFDVEFGIEVVDSQDGVGMDKITEGVLPEICMADCWEKPLS